MGQKKDTVTNEGIRKREELMAKKRKKIVRGILGIIVLVFLFGTGVLYSIQLYGKLILEENNKVSYSANTAIFLTQDEIMTIMELNAKGEESGVEEIALTEVQE